jgi:hypothetical protein
VGADATPHCMVQQAALPHLAYVPRCSPDCMLYLSTLPAPLPTNPKLPQRLRHTAVTGESTSAAPPRAARRDLGGGRSTCSPRVKCVRRHTYAEASPSCAVMTLAQSRSRTRGCVEAISRNKKEIQNI